MERPLKYNGQTPDPSPDEIRERCEEIQASWPPHHERSRRQWSVDREVVETPMVLDGEFEIAL